MLNTVHHIPSSFHWRCCSVLGLKTLSNSWHIYHHISIHYCIRLDAKSWGIVCVCVFVPDGTSWISSVCVCALNPDGSGHKGKQEEALNSHLNEGAAALNNGATLDWAGLWRPTFHIDCTWLVNTLSSDRDLVSSTVVWPTAHFPREWNRSLMPPQCFFVSWLLVKGVVVWVLTLLMSIHERDHSSNSCSNTNIIVCQHLCLSQQALFFEIHNDFLLNDFLESFFITCHFDLMSQLIPISLFCIEFSKISDPSCRIEAKQRAMSVGQSRATWDLLWSLSEQLSFHFRAYLICLTHENVPEASSVKSEQ